jgi:rod shape-determining protein MreB
MNRLTDSIVVDIGAGTTDICPIYGTYPKEEDQVTVALGGDAIDEAFLRKMREAHPQAQLSLNMAREIKEKFGFVHEVNETAVVELPVNGRPTPLDVSAALKEACKLIVAPIVEGLRNGRCPFRSGIPTPERNIVLAGGGSQLAVWIGSLKSPFVPWAAVK